MNAGSNVNTNGSSYDTVLSLWVGRCTFAWPVACDDDSGSGLDSQHDAVPVAGGNDVLATDVKEAPAGVPDGVRWDLLDVTRRDDVLDAIRSEDDQLEARLLNEHLTIVGAAVEG